MAIDNHSAFEVVKSVVGDGRAFSVYRRPSGELTVIIEHLSARERQQIEEVVGEVIKLIPGRPRRLPKRA